MKIMCDLEQTEADAIDQVYFGKRKELLDGAAHFMVSYLASVIEYEYTTAVSGAMRWPWSREAVVLKRIQLKYA